METCLILCHRVRCLSCSLKEAKARFKVIIFHRVGRQVGSSNDFGLTRIRLGEKATDHEQALVKKVREENLKITIMQMVNLNFKCKCYSRVSAVRAAGNDATGRRKCEPRRGEGGGGVV